MVEKAISFVKEHVVATVVTSVATVVVLFLGINTVANGQKGVLKYLNGRTWVKSMCSCCKKEAKPEPKPKPEPKDE